jgi:hypothetical protein
MRRLELRRTLALATALVNLRGGRERRGLVLLIRPGVKSRGDASMIVKS